MILPSLEHSDAIRQLLVNPRRIAVCNAETNFSLLLKKYVCRVISVGLDITINLILTVVALNTKCQLESLSVFTDFLRNVL